MNKKNIFKIFIIFFSISFFSCAQRPPVISKLSVKRLGVETNSEKLLERLSVFLLFSDENGRDDYNSIRITHKESGLYWQLNRDNSSFFISAKAEDEKEKFWLGSNKIAHPSGRMPLGEYSIVVDDLAGNQSVKNIHLKDETNLSALPFSFNIEGESCKIKNSDVQYKKFYLILLGADRQPIFVKELGEIFDQDYTGNLAALKKEYSDARYIQCMAENSQATISFLTKPYSLF